MRLRAALTGSSIWKPVRASQPGIARRLNTLSANTSARGHDVGGQAQRQGGEDVDGATEGDQAGDLPRPPIGRRLIREHPTLGVPDEVHRTTGLLVDEVDDLVEGDDVVGERALHAAGDLIG